MVGRPQKGREGCCLSENEEVDKRAQKKSARRNPSPDSDQNFVCLEQKTPDRESAYNVKIEGRMVLLKRY